MELAEVVVSYSLQLDTRCLRYLAEVGHAADIRRAHCADDTEQPGIIAESALVRDLRRLVRIWEWLWPLVEEGRSHSLAGHWRMVRQTSAALAAGQVPNSLAYRMANVAQDDELKQQLLRFAAAVSRGSVHGPSEPPDWAHLNDLFATDSAIWRSDVGLHHIDPEDLQARLVKNYKKARKSAIAWHSAAKPLRLGDTDEVLSCRKIANRMERLAYPLELLRPGLSEKARGQLWFAVKLAETLRMQNDLDGLMERAVKIQDPAYSTMVHKCAVQQYIQEQTMRMQRRATRLIPDALRAKPARFEKYVHEAVTVLTGIAAH